MILLVFVEPRSLPRNGNHPNGLCANVQICIPPLPLPSTASYVLCVLHFPGAIICWLCIICGQSYCWWRCSSASAKLATSGWPSIGWDAYEPTAPERSARKCTPLNRKRLRRTRHRSMAMRSSGKRLPLGWERPGSPCWPWLVWRASYGLSSDEINVVSSAMV